MALEKTITLQDNFGLDRSFTDAYIKVSEVSGTKQSVAVGVQFYTEANGQLLKSKVYSFEPSMDGDNFIAQAYAHLKTLSEFSGATDV